MKTKVLPKASALLTTFVLTLIATTTIPPFKASFSQGITIDGKKPDGSPVHRLLILTHSRNQEVVTAGLAPPSEIFVLAHRGFQPCSRYADAMEITPDQEAKIKQLLELTQATLQASFRRDLETLKPIKTPTKEQMDQVEQQMELGSKRRIETVAAADQFLLSGVLTESQAEMLTRFKWSSEGARALKDDALARRLGLNQDQRTLIARRLEEGDRSISKADGRMIAIGKMSNEADRAWQEARETRKATEAHVWEVLKPEQVDQWKQMIQSLPSVWPNKR
jgi:hypothetical protein